MSDVTRRAPRTTSALGSRNGGPISSTPEQSAAALFGIAQAEAETIHAAPMNIFEIIPDPIQPRRAVPSQLRTSWNSDVTPDAMHRLFADWEALAQSESADHPLFIRQWLRGDTPQDDIKRGPAALALMAVIDLAASVYHSGLTNPITVARTANGFQLETGERRWLAYHLLYDVHSGDPRWAQIPARIVPTFDRFRQAAENTQRGDLTAVAKVRQYALLLMELRRQEGDTFKPHEAFEHDRDFYAQVAGRAAPDGKNELLLMACGIKTKSTASKYRSVLALTNEQWIIADDEGLSFDAIKGRFAVTNSPSAKREKTSPAALHISQAKKMQKASVKTAAKYTSHEREELKRTLREWLEALG